MSMLLIAAAFGALHEVEVAVSPGPTTVSPRETSRHSIRVFRGIATGHTDTVVTTSSSHIKCAIEGGDVTVTVSWDPHAYPTFPSFADCVYGADTLRVYPVVDLETWAWGDSPPDIVGGSIIIERDADAIGYTNYPLPPAGTYAAGVHTAQRSGGAWEGVECETALASDNKWYVAVKVLSPKAAYGEGTCEIPNARGLPYQLGLYLPAY